MFGLSFLFLGICFVLIESAQALWPHIEHEVIAFFDWLVFYADLIRDDFKHQPMWVRGLVIGSVGVFIVLISGNLLDKALDGEG